LEDYIFYEGELPSAYQIDFEQAIFNMPDHRLLQASTGWSSFFILHPKTIKVVAAVYFHVSDSIARSPLKNPFGSIEFADGVPLPLLFQFLEFIEQKLRSKNISAIIINAPPQKYSHHTALLSIFLLNNDYKIKQAKVGAVIEVDENPIQKILHRSEKRRLIKSQKAGLSFREVPMVKLCCIYKFIETCREAKGYQLSLTLQELQQTINKFPEHYFLFGVYKEEQLVAASIAIRVQQNVLYEFYHDHAAEWNHLSPVVLLVEGIYRYCQSQNIALLDLGTSAVDDRPNFGLLNFKLKLGARPTPKFTFEKTLR
jgi:hypothetical protein